MYVCLCMGVSDKDIKKVVREGACSAAEVMRCTGAGTRCGSCVSEVVSLVEGAGSSASTSHRFLPVCPSSNAA